MRNHASYLEYSFDFAFNFRFWMQSHGVILTILLIICLRFCLGIYYLIVRKINKLLRFRRQPEQKYTSKYFSNTFFLAKALSRSQCHAIVRESISCVCTYSLHRL